MNGLTLLIVIAVVGAAGTYLHARYLPLQRCPRCKDRPAGGGALSTGKAFNRRCRACGGTGQRVRPLARVLHAAVNMPVRERKER